MLGTRPRQTLYATLSSPMVDIAQRLGQALTNRIFSAPPLMFSGLRLLSVPSTKAHVSLYVSLVICQMQKLRPSCSTPTSLT